MNKSRIFRYALPALAVTWIILSTSAFAQMPIMIGETLMPDSERSDTGTTGTEVAVDESGNWLKLRTATNDHARRVSGMAELLEFDAAETLTTFETGTQLRADDYRFPAEASPGRRVWLYDGDPLDRGVYKQELGGASGSGRTMNSTRTRFNTTVARPTQPAQSSRSEGRIGRAQVVELIIRTPGIVVNAVRSVYQNGNATFMGIGLIALVIGFSTLRDLASGARRA